MGLFEVMLEGRRVVKARVVPVGVGLTAPVESLLESLVLLVDAMGLQTADNALLALRIEDSMEEVMRSLFLLVFK